MNAQSDNKGKKKSVIKLIEAIMKFEGFNGVNQMKAKYGHYGSETVEIFCDFAFAFAFAFALLHFIIIGCFILFDNFLADLSLC